MLSDEVLAAGGAGLAGGRLEDALLPPAPAGGGSWWQRWRRRPGQAADVEAAGGSGLRTGEAGPSTARDRLARSASPHSLTGPPHFAESCPLQCLTSTCQLWS